MYDCMIKNGTIVSAEGMFDADIAVKNGKIAAIGKKLCGNAKHNIDASGGVTTAVDMPLNLYTPSVLTKEAVQLKDRLLDQESYIDYVMWGGLTPDSISNLHEMKEAGAISFKCFMSGGGNDFAAPSIGEIRHAMKIIASFHGLVGFHCEDASVIDFERRKVRSLKLDGRH